MTDDLNNFLKTLDRYRSAVHVDIFLQECIRMGYLESGMDDTYEQKQDRQRGLQVRAGKSGLRYVEEMTVYDADGTMLGSMTLSQSLVEPRWCVPDWLTPAFIRTDITREDLIRARR